MSGKLQQIHVRVNDAATGKPTPCRVRFSDAERPFVAPHGRTVDIPWSFEEAGRSVGGYVSDVEQWCYIDGTCEIDLSPGPIEIVIEKGPEYERLARAITLAPGKLALRFDLQRLFDPRTTGWYAGAIAHTAQSPHEASLEGAAEGLRIVDLLAYERESTIDGKELRPVWCTRELGLFEPGDDDAPPQETLIDYPNLIAFSGQRLCVESPDCLVAVNTLNRHAGLGELALLNCHRIVFPLRVGRSPFPGSAHHRPDNWTLADWCDQCHRKHGLVIGRSLHWSESDPWYGGEALADAILGKIDAVSFWQNWRDWWYTLLSLGLRLPIVAHLGLRPLGMQRTYARLQTGQDFSYTSWIEAIRAGRTCVTWGPFLTLTVNGADPGGCIDLEREGDVVRILRRSGVTDVFP